MTTYKVSNFPYNKMTLGKPHPLQGGGSYFTKLTIDDKPIYIQIPKCETKNGVIETKRQKYIDMMYTRENESELADWIERLENQCQELINIKKDTWFANDITREDLESMMTPLSRLYKSGTKLLIRGYIDLDKKTNEPICRIYDEKETIRTLSDIQQATKITPLIQIEGIKFTSRSFDVEIRIIQILIIDQSEQTSPELFYLIKDKHDNLDNTHNQPKKVEQQVEKQLEKHVDLEEKTEATIKEDKKIIHKEDNGLREELELNCIEVLPNLEKKQELEEVILDISDDEPIKLKNKNEVYKEIYHAALEKAKHMRNVAIQAFLEAKEIKTKYLLSDLDDSDEELENTSFCE
jgi:arsenate reductase-like glutaredoxin family protein